MKLFITFLLFFSFLLTNGQSNYQIADTSKQWNTIHIGHGAFMIHYCGGTSNNKLEGEYVIDSVTYLKVQQSDDSLQTNWDVYGLLREDTISKRVYFHSGWDWDDEGLIYDFNIEIGDTVNIDNLYTTYNSQLICEDIDSVLVGENLKKRFLFSSPYYYYPAETWIEGIGSVFGLFYSGLGGVAIAGGTTQLLCCSKNDTIIYMDSVFEQCYMDQFYPQLLTESFDTAYLNEYYEFQVQVDTSSVSSFSFDGINIPEGFYLNESNGIITGTPDSLGSYSCAISVRNNDYGFPTDILQSYITVIQPVSIINKVDDTDFGVYPNPASDYITLSASNCYMQLTNSSGQLILTTSPGEKTISLEGIPPGLYVATVIEGKEVTGREKLIIQ